MERKVRAGCGAGLAATASPRDGERPELDGTGRLMLVESFARLARRPREGPRVRKGRTVLVWVPATTRLLDAEPVRRLAAVLAPPVPRSHRRLAAVLARTADTPIPDWLGDDIEQA